MRKSYVCVLLNFSPIFLKESLVQGFVVVNFFQGLVNTRFSNLTQLGFFFLVSEGERENTCDEYLNNVWSRWQ